MGSSRRSIFTPPPPPNPNPQGVGPSKATYNVPVVSPYETQNYQPFFTQAANTPQIGSYFNRYGDAGQPPADLPNVARSGINTGLNNFATATRTNGLLGF